MSTLVFQHQANEPAARLGVALRDHGHKLRVVHLYKGDPVPPDLDDVDGIVSLGGDMSVDQTAEYPWLQQEMDYLKTAHEAGVPIVGICLGAQLIAQALGGKVEKMEKPEIGFDTVRQAFPGTIETLYGGIPWNTVQFHYHSDEVTQLPPGAVGLAGSKRCKNQAFKAGFTTYGFQYHFEWMADKIREVADSETARAAGIGPDAIEADLERYYDGFRRQGDRLCERITLMLFSTTKRLFA